MADFQVEVLKRLTALESRVNGLLKPGRSRILNWQPTVTQSGSVTITITHARYTIIDRMICLRARLAVTGTGTANNSILIAGLPYPPLDASGILGTIMITDTGTAFYVGALLFNSSSSLAGRAHGLGSNIGVTPNFALASGDIIDIVGMYEKDA